MDRLALCAYLLVITIWRSPLSVMFHHEQHLASEHNGHQLQKPPVTQSRPVPKYRVKLSPEQGVLLPTFAIF